MPTYEYRCPEGHEFEQFVRKISDAAPTVPCPTCGLVAPRRMSAGGGLLFKGSGFYITDYGKDGKKDQKPATPAAPAAAGASASGGSADKAAPAAAGSTAGPAPAPKSSAAPAAPAKPKPGPDK